jgi:hypothetical protein
VVKKNVIENIIPIVIALKVSEFWLLVVQILLQKSFFFPKGHSIQTNKFSHIKLPLNFSIV